MLMAKARQSIGDPLVPILGHSSVNLAFRSSRVAVQMQLQVREKGRLQMQGDRKWNSARPKQCELLQRTGCFCVLGTAFPYCDAQRTRDTLTASQYYRLGGEIAQQGNGFVKMNQSDHNCVSGIELCQQMVSCGYILCYGTKGKQTITTGATPRIHVSSIKSSPKKHTSWKFRATQPTSAVLAVNEAGVPRTYTKPNTEKSPLLDLGNPRILVVEGPGPLNTSVTSKIELPRTINYYSAQSIYVSGGTVAEKQS
ncbi:hypothetical protein NOF04DRAFT_1356346 [Fusarium oxysporum II5]|nr:hypothetical protein NOF04DRAFT_1356346 [Fusarium oxysporum II5]